MGGLGRERGRGTYKAKIVFMFDQPTQSPPINCAVVAACATDVYSRSCEIENFIGGCGGSSRQHRHATEIAAGGQVYN